MRQRKFNQKFVNSDKRKFLNLAMRKEYSSDFYARIDDASAVSAAVVVPIIRHLFSPSSVVDFGCGTGQWLNEFAENGTSDIYGLDFGGMNPDQIAIDPEHFESTDLGLEIHLNRRFDVALSLEVAEHLPQEAAGTFIGNLVRHSDVVVFSAAIPGQRGLCHINCQYQSYWSQHFIQHGYQCYDLIRPIIWHNETVPFWYRQNTLVYVDQTVAKKFPNACASPNDWIDIVHPEMLRHNEQHLKSRLREVHVRYQERIRSTKQEIWSKARKKLFENSSW